MMMLKRLVFRVLLLLLAPLVWAQQGGNPLPDLAGNSISKEDERAMGKTGIREIMSSSAYLDDAVLTGYLQDMVLRLLSHTPPTAFPIEVFVLNDRRINAFAMPGGFIGINTGLITAAESESEVVAVLAHEIGHVEQRHIARMLEQRERNQLSTLAMYLAGLSLMFSKNPDAGLAVILGGQATLNSQALQYSREAETEADRVGFSLLARANMDTSALLSFFQRLERTNNYAENASTSFLRTHPLTAERIADMQNHVNGFSMTRQLVPLALDEGRFRRMQMRARLLQADAGERDALVTQWRQEVGGKNDKTLAYSLAFADFLEDRLDASVAQFRALAKRFPEDVDILYSRYQAENAMLEHRPDPTAGQALVASIQQSITHHPLYQPFITQLADSYIALSRWQEAIDRLTAALAIDPTNLDWYERLARAYAGNGQSYLQHRTLADLFVRFESYPRAIEQLEVAINAPDASSHDKDVAKEQLKRYRQLVIDRRAKR